MSLTVERSYPVVMAAVAGAVAWHFKWSLPPDLKEFLAAALGLGAVLTGFIATAQAILMALPSESVMGKLKSSGYVHILVAYIAEALYAGVGFCGVNLVGFFVIAHAELSLYLAVAWVVLALYSALSFIRVTKLMMTIMKSS